MNTHYGLKTGEVLQTVYWKGADSMRIMRMVAVVGCLSWGGALAQPPVKDPGGNRVPVVAPLHLPGMPGVMENSPPMILDVTELRNLLSEIGIAQQTTDKVTAIVRAFIAELDGRLIKVKREELNIKEELLKEKPDLKALQNYVAKKAVIFSEIEFAQIKRDLEIKSLLTQDEYDKWKSVMMKKMRQAMPPMMGKDGPNPDPR